MQKGLSSSHCPRQHLAIQCWFYIHLLKHGVNPCDFHTDFILYSEFLCLMLCLQCVITSIVPSLLESSTCCPTAPGTLVLPVLHTAWNEGQPMGTQCSHLTHLRHKNPISSLPIPTAKKQTSSYTPCQYKSSGNQQYPLSTAICWACHKPDIFPQLIPWLNSSFHNRQFSRGQGMTLLIIFII